MKLSLSVVKLQFCGFSYLRYDNIVIIWVTVILKKLLNVLQKRDSICGCNHDFRLSLWNYPFFF